MDEVDEFLKAENQFKIPNAFMAKPGDKVYSSPVENLNQILNRKPMYIYMGDKK